ncbi:MAG: hypothetical protein AB8F95_05130 [Bacteroidia bacterium]
MSKALKWITGSGKCWICVMFIVVMAACGGPAGINDRLSVIISTQNDIDSVQCFVLNEDAIDIDGSIDIDIVKKAVHESVQSMEYAPVFIEVFSTEDDHLLFLQNLEVLRREFIRAGLDSVMVSTRKKARPLQSAEGLHYGFSVVQFGS